MVIAWANGCQVYPWLAHPLDTSSTSLELQAFSWNTNGYPRCIKLLNPCLLCLTNWAGSRGLAKNKTDVASVLMDSAVCERQTLNRKSHNHSVKVEMGSLEGISLSAETQANASKALSTSSMHFWCCSSTTNERLGCAVVSRSTMSFGVPEAFSLSLPWKLAWGGRDFLPPLYHSPTYTSLSLRVAGAPKSWQPCYQMRHFFSHLPAEWLLLVIKKSRSEQQRVWPMWSKLTW